ncbi:UNVERIFIED_ORG: TetR family transcriptional regulator [Nocardia globerula]|uniref:TetR family transcriptional regulator n=1 Tax=Nocardia globerula TaxID=1818 RepID=A0A652YSM6_NOCGL|nr:TetR/AcrR family transcriptional regulator [Rhodococcus globerulus]NMD61330.1 TetR/AcrR family transcriptional regulator [Nocardia globerula]PVX67118.1 TetR family transcriptional regulator [Rhodococcus globerulus]
MSETPITRRASYGPSSPEVGSRGANTRSKIVEVSLDLFAEVGFFNTSVDAIAKSANISRATLYQYFPGKDEIFLELLDECGRALFRVARRIGPLGPTDVGFDNLNWWLGEWSWVFEKYSTMFVQWTGVASSDTAVRPEISRFLGGYNQRLADRIKSSNVEGLDSMAAAMTITALVHRMNLFIHTDRAYGRDIQSIVDAMSVYLQLFLFPETPGSVLSSLPLRTAGKSFIEVPVPPSTDGLTIDDRISGLSKRAVNTVRTLVEAGAVQFRQKGYHRTSVDDIVEEAGFARGTFYKYFSEKQDLLVALSTEAVASTVDHAERIRHIDPTSTDETELREWLVSFAEFSSHYSGSIDAWAEKSIGDNIVSELGAYGQSVMDDALLSVLTSRQRDYPFDPEVSAMIFRAIIARVPQASQELPEPLSRDESIDLLVACIQRGFFRHAK